MTSLPYRKPYTDQEIRLLYPRGLQLRLVHMFFRHGERTPSAPRFENAGLPPFWPYCRHVSQLKAIVKSSQDHRDGLNWSRQLEISDAHGAYRLASGPGGETEGLCFHSELTEKGRESMHNLGRRLRHLYVKQLGFMPDVLHNEGTVSLRSTQFSRALESLQQVFMGFYPIHRRAETFGSSKIVTRALEDETLYPNDDHCQRFIQLVKAYSQRAARKWDKSEDMDYLNSLFQKWMPSQQRVAVNSYPRLHSIFDTINASLATSSRKTQLPREFYDPKALDIIDRIAVDEEYSGFKMSHEYRVLGIGGLLAEVVRQMTETVVQCSDRHLAAGRYASFSKYLQRLGVAGDDFESKGLKFAFFGCHDATLAAILASLGAMEGENSHWPPFSSSLAIELFEQRQDSKKIAARYASTHRQINDTAGSSSEPDVLNSDDSVSNDVSDPLRQFFVRLRYNDRPVVVSACRSSGRHLDGDETFCTLAAFKDAIDDFTPANWQQACISNLDKPAIIAAGDHS